MKIHCILFSCESSLGISLARCFYNKIYYLPLTLAGCTATVYIPYLPVYKSIPCISRPPIFDGKKCNFFISLLNVHGTLILYSSISGNVDTQKNQGLKRLIVMLFNSCCICGHFVLEFRKSSQKIEHMHVNLKLTCFVVQG